MAPARRWPTLRRERPDCRAYPARASQPGVGVRTNSHSTRTVDHAGHVRSVDSDLEDRTETVSQRDDGRLWLAVWLGLAIITALAVWRLRDFAYHLSWLAALHGMSEVWAATLSASLPIWIFWAWGGGVSARLLLRIDPEIDLADAILGGVGGLWALGYFLGVLAGPLGLFNTATLWSLLALGTVWLWYHPPSIPRATLSTGQKFALLATGLLAVSMLPLQLASPVAPS